jgi:RHS repeat-associated protein
MTARRVTSTALMTEQQQSEFRRVTSVTLLTEQQQSGFRRLTSTALLFEKTATGPQEGSNSARCDCASGVHNCRVFTGNPLNIRNGDKLEEATDLTVTTPGGQLSFTRSYLQSKQSKYQFMGLGWNHNHNYSLDAANPNRVIVYLGNGGEAPFNLDRTETVGGITTVNYIPDPGISSTLVKVNTQYTLTTTDQATFVFNADGQLMSRTWAQGESWTYTYYASGSHIGKLSEVADIGYNLNGTALKRKLVFRYYDTGPFIGHLYRVGDHTFDDSTPAQPTGRYVEYGYGSRQIINGSVLQPETGSSQKGLLVSVKDVRGQLWTYTYYGQNAGETNTSLANYLVNHFSPVLDTTGDSQPDGMVMLERVTYTKSGGAITSIQQGRGFSGVEMVTNGSMEDDNGWTAIVNAAPITNIRSFSRVDSGAYARYVNAQAAAHGIESAAWNMQANRTYVVTARVLPVTGVVKLGVPGVSALERLTHSLGVWNTLQAVFTPTANTSSCRIQFTAQGGSAEFYVDGVSVTEVSPSAVLSTTYEFQPSGQNVTYEKIAGLESLRTIHRFQNGVYAGAEDPAGNFGYTNQNFEYRPYEQVDANGNRTAFRWSADGKRLEKVYDALENATEFKYDNQDRLLQSIDAQGRITQYAYTNVNVSRQPTEVKVLDTDGVSVLRWQKFTYDTKGRILTQQVVNPLDGVTVQQTSHTYWSLGDSNDAGVGLLRKATQEDLLNPANNQETTYFYDLAGRVVQTNRSPTFGDCCKAYTVYDEAGIVLRTVDNYEAQGNTTPHSWKLNTAVTPPVWQYPNGSTWENVDHGSTGQQNRVTLYEYDSLGRRIKTVNNSGTEHAQTTLTVYDALGRIVRTISHYVENVAIPHPYTAAHSAFTHGTNNTDNLVTDTFYNERGIVRKSVDVSGNATLYGYDDAGRMVKTVINASIPNYNNDYTGGDPDLSDYGDDPGVPGVDTNLISTDPDKDIITRNVYDAVGNLVQSVDAIGNVTFNIYDSLNRVVKTVRNAKDAATIALNPGDVGYSVQNDPRVSGYVASTAADRDLITSTEYDSMGRVVRTADTSGQVTYSVYDSLDRVVRSIVNYVPQGSTDPKDWQWNEVVSPARWEYYNGSAWVAVDHGAGNDGNVITLTVFDTQGRVLYTQDMLGRRIWHKYDGMGRVVKTIANAVGTATDGSANDPRTYERTYSNGELVDSENNQISKTEYDTMGRVRWSEDTLGRKTWYVYDSLGRQKKVIRNCTYTSGTPLPEEDTYVGSSDADKDIITHTTYDAQERMLDMVDPVGNVTRRIYDKLGRTVRTIGNYVAQGATDPANWYFNESVTPARWERSSSDTTPIDHGTNFDQNHITVTTYDVQGRVSVTRDVRGTKTVLFYDSAGRRVRVVQASGTPLAMTSYTVYDKAGRVLRTVSNYIPQGTSTPERWRLNTSVTPPGWEYLDGTSWRAVEHGLAEDWNLVSAYTLDRFGRQVSVSDPLGNAGTTVYAKEGQVLSMTDPEGTVTVYRYDKLRRRTLTVQGFVAGTLTDPATWVWDDAVGQKRWEDGTGADIHPVGTPTDRNVIVQVTYDRAGRVTRMRDARGNPTDYTYDKLNRRTSLKNPLNHTWSTTYNTLAGGTMRTQVTNPLSQAVRQVTDGAGRLRTLEYLSESPKLTPDVTFTYDKLGNRTLMSESNGVGTVRRTGYNYDKANRLTSAAFDKNGDGTTDETVSYAYDMSGRCTRLTLPGNLNVTYSYDTRGQLVSLTDWNSGGTDYAYDGVGRLKGILRQGGFRSVYDYDRSSRLRTMRHVKDGNTLGHFAYTVDKRGNRTSALEVLPRATAGNMLFGISDPAVHYYSGSWATVGSFRESTNATAALRVLCLGGVTLTMGTGPDCSIYDISVNGGLWKSVDGYATSAGSTSIPLPLDGDGPWLIEVENRAEKNLQSSGYKLRFRELTTTRTFDAQLLTYSYDALSRLTSAVYAPGVNTAATPARQYTYTYDRAGNRTAQTVTLSGVATTTTYEYDPANRLIQDSLHEYKYSPDANGISQGSNLTHVDGVEVYTWDRADRLRSYNGVSYEYNGLGQRVKSTASSIATEYLLNVQPGLYQVIAATKTNNGATDRFIHGPRGIQGQYDNSGNWEYMVQDGLGSIRTVVGASLNVLESRLYSPYGEPFGTTGTNQTPFEFTGEPKDANGLLHLRARYYNPALGVFLNLDPLEESLVNEWISNRYNYVHGNVTTLTDPFGLLPCDDATNDHERWHCLNTIAAKLRNYTVGGGILAILPGQGGYHMASYLLSHYLSGSGEDLWVFPNYFAFTDTTYNQVDELVWEAIQNSQQVSTFVNTVCSSCTNVMQPTQSINVFFNESIGELGSLYNAYGGGGFAARSLTSSTMSTVCIGNSYNVEVSTPIELNDKYDWCFGTQGCEASDTHFQGAVTVGEFFALERAGWAKQFDWYSGWTLITSFTIQCEGGTGTLQRNNVRRESLPGVQTESGGIISRPFINLQQSGYMPQRPPDPDSTLDCDDSEQKGVCR